MPEISLVVPVFDEEDNLRDLHQAITDALTGMSYEVLYVNDGSVDRSAAVLDELARADTRARVIHFVRNYGQTAALTAGIRNARAPILVTLDADMQNDPADIPRMIDMLDEGCDVVCGWRKDRKDNTLTRTLPSKAANWLISRLSNVPLHDYGCTLRVYKREFIKDIPLYGEMHRFIPIYVTWAGARLTEVPVRHHPRTQGVSKYGLWRIPKVLLDLTTLKFLRDFFVTPIYFFGWLGIFLVAGGSLAMASALAAYLTGAEGLAIGLMVLGPLLASLGLVEITLGIIAEVLIRMHYELQHKEPYRIGETRNMEA
ncbi:MAG: glycosyltransferase family 2 protein [Myxococcota bacterium]|nr:glycosyltransferase family 2 protein [Myxococcota bacterium]